jgi:Mlc titration factor MtfA (ptsG expression regulator)
LKTIVVMPKRFAQTRRQGDRAGMVREWSEVDIGQSRDKGPVVLSWKDVEAPGMADGFNEVIYEAVHCLDLLEGAVNGRLTFQGSVAIYSPRNHSWNFGRRKASP